MKPRTPRQAARHARILAVARQLVTRHGYEGLTMRDLAAEANVSPTTLYNLYNNKDELVLASVFDLLTVAREVLDRVAPELGYERLLAATDVQALQVERGPEYAKAITRALLQAPPDHPLVKTLLKDTFKLSLESLRVMAERNQLRKDADLTQIARLLTGSPWATMLLWSKEMVPLAELRRVLRDGLLVILIAHTTPGTRRILQQRLAGEPEPLELPQQPAGWVGASAG